MFIIALFCGRTKNVYASNFYQEKIYCDVNIEESFDDDSVIVIMDKSLSGVNKVHSVEFFGSHLIKEVKDLTFRNSNFSTENFKQILKLTLHKKKINFFSDTKLRRIRTLFGCTQKQLSELSGVGFRSIQMYEQRQKDINKASLETVYYIQKR